MSYPPLSTVAELLLPFDVGGLNMNENRKSSNTSGVLAFGCGAPFLLYLAGYFYVRLSHHLVSYGSFIAKGGVAEPAYDTSWLQFFYAPMIMLEEFVRF